MMRMSKEKDKMLKAFVEDLLRMEHLNFRDKAHIFKSDLEPAFWKAPFSWLRRGKQEDSQEWKDLAQKIAIFYAEFSEKISRIDPEEILKIDLKEKSPAEKAEDTKR